MQQDAARYASAAAAPQRPDRALRLRRLVLGFGALAVVCVLVGTSASLWRMHAEVMVQAEEHLQSLAQILGEHTLRSVHAVDAILAAAAEDAQRTAVQGRLIGSEELHRHMRDTIARTRFVRALILSEASGRPLIHTNEYPPQPIDYSEYDFFRAYRAQREAPREPPRPVVGQMDGERGLTISRRLDDADGRLLGIITAVVDPDYFLGPRGLQELGQDGVVRLLRRDGILLTGYPLTIAAVTNDYRDSALYTQGVRAGRTLIYHAGHAVPVDRVSAINVFDDYPLVVTVTASTGHILRTWSRDAWVFGTLAAATSVFLALITLSLARQLRVEEELKSVVIESEERLHSIIQSAMDAIITLDAEQRILLFNAAAEQTFRCPSAQALGTDIGRFIPGRLLNAAPQGAAESSDGSTPMHKMGEHLALTGVRADGEEFPIDASLSRTRLRDKEIFIVILRDVTERKRVEAVLRENERRYRTLFSRAMDGILLVDAQGKIVDVNESFAKMHGYSVSELLQTNLLDLDTAETAAHAPGRLKRMLAGQALSFEVEHHHRDGHVLPLDVASSAIEIDGNLFVLAFHRDITERRRAEEDIRRSQRELRELSKAAHDALEAERRRTARELHDELGQSLTALKMDLESMRAELPSHPELERRAQGMHTLLDGTIAATRRIAADLRPLMLDDLGLAAALDWLTHSFSQRTGIATDLIIDETVAQIGEPVASALYRITQESLTNVAKYAQATTAEIRLEGNGEWVQLAVRDNGRGIDAADHGKRGAFGLLGIRERVTLLGGEVAITGQPGRGSEVRVRIPLAAVGAEGALA